MSDDSLRIWIGSATVTLLDRGTLELDGGVVAVVVPGRRALRVAVGVGALLVSVPLPLPGLPNPPAEATWPSSGGLMTTAGVGPADVTTGAGVDAVRVGVVVGPPMGRPVGLPVGVLVAVGLGTGRVRVEVGVGFGVSVGLGDGCLLGEDDSSSPWPCPTGCFVGSAGLIVGAGVGLCVGDGVRLTPGVGFPCGRLTGGPGCGTHRVTMSANQAHVVGFAGVTRCDVAARSEATG